MKDPFSDNLSISSSASSLAVLSAPLATSTTSENPSFFMAVESLRKDASNCPTRAGAVMAATFLPLLRARSMSTSWLRSSTAPKGHAATQQPQLMHFVKSIDATPCSPFVMASTGQFSSQGTDIFEMA
ncbi:hypothetical protein SDC9_190880 [bioreactor metagenome]|uniref:Uncharacterized protein n=1 Tax=bioreactor metagenome TaxID=1076179 RepID=A0A645HW90_9ZZZZ